MQMLFGLPPVMAAGRDTLPLFLQMYEGSGYHADETMMYGTQVENTDLFPQQAQLVKKWNEAYAYPHLEFSGFYDALRSIQQQFGNDIPTIRGDGGPYWEDGIASDAYYAGIERWNEGRAPTAEKFATLTSIVNPLLRPDMADLDRMWTNMILMDEHTWDSYNSISDPTSMEAIKQLKVKDQYAVSAQAIADFITRNSMASLTGAIPIGANKVVVFNSLNWKRSGLVSIDITKNSDLVDLSTGQTVPVETLYKGPSFYHAQFMATDIPPVGYKVYEMRPSTAPSPAPATQQDLTLENTYYRVTLDPSAGAIKSIYDKQLNHELVNQNSPYRFGQYLYVTGGDKAPNTVLQYSHVYPKPALDVHPSEGGSVVSVSHTPYGTVARMRSSDVNTPSITSEIRLFDQTKKIELVEDFEKKDVDTKEGVYFASLRDEAAGDSIRSAERLDPAENDPLPEGSRHLCAVQHQRDTAEPEEIPGTHRHWARRVARVAGCGRPEELCRYPRQRFLSAHRPGRKEIHVIPKGDRRGEPARVAMAHGFEGDGRAAARIRATGGFHGRQRGPFATIGVRRDRLRQGASGNFVI